MSAPDIATELRAVENIHAILSARTLGIVGVIPPEFAKFTNRQIAAALCQAAVVILDRVTEAEQVAS